MQFANIMRQDLYIHSISAGNFILQKFVKMWECHFWADSLVSGLLGPPLLKSCRVWGWFIPKKNSYLNNLPVKQIEEKAQCAFMSLFLTTSNGSHDRNEKSYIERENWKVLSYMRNTKSLIRYMEDYNVYPMSAHFPQILPNVVHGQISDFFRYVPCYRGNSLTIIE